MDADTTPAGARHRAEIPGQDLPRGQIPKARLTDTVAAVTKILLPTLGKGVIIRRPWVVGLAERHGLDARAVRRMQRLRDRYGEGPLLLGLPARPQALIFAAEDLHRILVETPHPFSADTSEKHAALAHLEPRASLISEGAERSERRRFNGEVLEEDRRVHRLAAPFLAVVDAEAKRLVQVARAGGALTWKDFARSWNRIVRGVVLGDRARDDERLTEMLATLRSAANWAFLRPRRRRRLAQFHARLDAHLARGEAGSLASMIAARGGARDVAPTDQVAHWLFAFDPAGMATYRALALLVAHPQQADRARAEIAQADRSDGPGGRAELPLLRAAILESLRLWPTTPVVLRETRDETQWSNGRLPAGTSIILYAPFFHRDGSRLPFADRFAPEIWGAGGRAEAWPLIPFSGGPGICPARHLVPMLGAAMIAALLDGGEIRLEGRKRFGGDRPMPATLDNYSLRFRFDS